MKRSEMEEKKYVNINWLLLIFKSVLLLHALERTQLVKITVREILYWIQTRCILLLGEQILTILISYASSENI